MELPKYKNWTVDYRLKQFRKVHWTKTGNPAKIEFEDFEDPKGDKMLSQMIRKGLVPNEILVNLF